MSSFNPWPAFAARVVNQTNGEERVEVKPRVIFMATMRSLMSNEEIAAIDKQVKCLVEPFSDLIVYNGSGVLFLWTASQVMASQHFVELCVTRLIVKLPRSQVVYHTHHQCVR